MRHIAFFMMFLIGMLAVMAVVPTLAQDDEFVFGLVLVGAEDDNGWSEAHFEAGHYVEEQIPGTRMIFFPKLNPADSPEVTLQGVVDEMVAEGAQLIFTTSDEFAESTDAVAEAYPDVTFMSVSGDNVLSGQAPPNLGNVMGQMEWGKLIAGCAAGLTTETGSIGYLGPLINAETRRLASSAFLGARYCYEHYDGNDPAELNFTVTWIGFWFNIPGVTLDPTEEVNTFFDSGVDVVISGIDTTEAIVATGQHAERGESVWAIPYDFAGACELAAEVCLGVPYFNWGPTYTSIVRQVQDGTWQQAWEWLPPDWNDINNPETSIVGYIPGEGLSEADAETLNTFIAELAEYATNPFVPDSIALWSGVLNLQDGSELAGDSELVPMLDIWYLPQLLQGMVGSSE